MVADRNEDIDVIGIADDELEAAVQVFFVRKGRVVGRKGFIVDKVEDVTPGGLVDRIMEEMYGDEPPLGIPKQVLVPVEPRRPRRRYEEWLTPHARVARADPRAAARRQARPARDRHPQRQGGVHPPSPAPRRPTTTAAAARSPSCRTCCSLPEAPLRIECYDMAHIQGTDYVGSMVVLEDGLPNKREYRRFKVKTVDGNDDYAAMEEVLTRRLTAYLDERDRPVNERGDRPGQVRVPAAAAARRRRQGPAGRRRAGGARRSVSTTRSRSPRSPSASRRCSCPASSEPVNIPRGSEALFMLQRIRDEAHRFANTFHRELRGKRMTKSSLDDIPGLGETRKKRLAKELGGVNAVKRASLERCKSLTWLPDSVAETIYPKFHPDEPVAGAVPVEIARLPEPDVVSDDETPAPSPSA